MHLTCTISRGWVCCADLKPSSQGWLSVGMIWSGTDLTRWWRSDLMVWFGCRVLRMVWCGTGIWWSDLGRISSSLEVCLRKMVWSESWKLKRWEAELIVENGSIREKRDSCTKKVRDKIGYKEAWEKIPTLLKTPPLPSPILPSAQPLSPNKFFVQFYSTCTVKPFLYVVT